MKKFFKQTFLGVMQSTDENETEQDLSFELKSEREKQFTRDATESGIELETELGPAKRLDGSGRPISEELFGQLKKVGNLDTSFSGEKSSHLVRGTGEGDGWTLPGVVISKRHSPEERSKRVAVGSFLEEGTVPWPQTVEQSHIREEGVNLIGTQEDFLPTKVPYDEIKVCPTNKTRQDGSITGLGEQKTSLSEHNQQEISKSENHRMEGGNSSKSEWELGSDSVHPFTPLWEMLIGSNSRAAIRHRVSKHLSDKEFASSEIDNHQTQEKEKFMLVTGKGPKREVILIPDQELTKGADQRGSNCHHEEQLFEEGLEKDAKMFKDFLVTDEPLLEDETLSLVGSSTSSDEDTDERFEENIINFYTPAPRSSYMDNFAENTNGPHIPVIPTGIPLRRSTTTMKFDKRDKEETNKFQMNSPSNPANDKYGTKSKLLVLSSN